jgi:hypothetical protein
VHLKCSQTGKKFIAKVCDISNEDGNTIAIDSIVPGLGVIAAVEGASYPAEVVTFEDSQGILGLGSSPSNRGDGCLSSPSNWGDGCLTVFL